MNKIKHKFLHNIMYAFSLPTVITDKFSLYEEISHLIYHVNDFIKNITNDINNIINEVNNINTDLENINSNIEKIQSDIVNIDNKINDIIKDINTLQENVGTLFNNLARVQTQQIINTNDITALKGNVRTLQDDVSDINKNIDTILSTIGTINDNINTINSTLSTHTAAISSINTDISNIKSKIDVFEKQIQENLTNINYLLSETESLKTQVSTNTTDIANNANEIQTQHNSIVDINNDISLMSTNIEKNTTDISTNTTDIGTLKTNLNTLSEQVHNIQLDDIPQIQQNTTDIQSNSTRIESVEDSLSNLTKMSEASRNWIIGDWAGGGQTDNDSDSVFTDSEINALIGDITGCQWSTKFYPNPNVLTYGFDINAMVDVEEFLHGKPNIDNVILIMSNRDIIDVDNSHLQEVIENTSVIDVGTNRFPIEMLFRILFMSKGVNLNINGFTSTHSNMIVCVIPQPPNELRSISVNGYNTVTETFDTIKKICELSGVPFIDLKHYLTFPYGIENLANLNSWLFDTDIDDRLIGNDHYFTRETYREFYRVIGKLAYPYLKNTNAVVHTTLEG